MKYKIQSKKPDSKYLNVEIEIQNTSQKAIKLQLPAWRPGRYQIQNFAKNVRNFTARNTEGESIDSKKISKDLWLITKNDSEVIFVTYEYYANQQDAGGSYVDSDMLYVNPINLLMYQPGSESKSCELSVKFSKNKSIACGLAYEKWEDTVNFSASSFHDMVDSPFIISNTLKHLQYEVNDTAFHFWVQGKVAYPWQRIVKDFEAFSISQINIFGEFPTPDYHFILWIPPHPYFHGVEHFNSTMMVLGPDSQNFDDMYPDLLGLSSHELFHTWNIKKIRPKELLPYRYDRENYFETCFIAEGFTTFYGDWILYRSNVFDRKSFQKELETTLRRHFDFDDESTLSLLESSFDLWLDGYEAGSPNRKVSVYNKGAVATLILNHELKKYINHPFPMDVIMRTMWLMYGKTGKGYTYKSFKKLVAKIAHNPIDDFFETVIEGNESIFEKAAEAVADFGFQLERNKDGRTILREKN